MKLDDALKLAFHLRQVEELRRNAPRLRLAGYRRTAEQIAEAAGTTLEALQRHRQRRWDVAIRTVIAECLYEQQATLVDIGRVLNRDHSTVAHMLKGRVGQMVQAVQMPMLEVVE